MSSELYWLFERWRGSSQSQVINKRTVMKADQVSRLRTRLIKMLHARPSRHRKCITPTPMKNHLIATWRNDNSVALSAVAVVQERAHFSRGL